MSVTYFDAHCHLQLDPLWERRAEVIFDARQRGVSQLVVAATCPGEDWVRVQQLVIEYPELIIPCYGLHPLWISECLMKYQSINPGKTPMACCSATLESRVGVEFGCIQCDQSRSCVQLANRGSLNLDDLLELKGALETNLITILSAESNACVGECGLDRRITAKSYGTICIPIELQKYILEVQLGVASKLRRVAVIHCVGYWGLLLEVVSKSRTGVIALGEKPPAIIIHSSNGMPIEIASTFKSMDNIYFSFSARHFNLKTKELVRCLPLDRILLETDSPDQLINYETALKLSSAERLLLHSTTLEIDLKSLHNLSESTVNEPKYLYFGCELLSVVLEMTHEQVAELLMNNSIRAFSPYCA
jgi:Tat protein secretion system quality control protein TatD with DNase activity